MVLLTAQRSLWLGIILVLGFGIWKFIIQPILNEGQPISPQKLGPRQDLD